jgi:hypothetical protein
MSETPYEDPRKRDLVHIALSAVEASGYAVNGTPNPIGLPASAGIVGELIGDFQAVDSSGVTNVYFVRTDSLKPIPQWVAKFAQVAHTMNQVKVNVVAQDPSDALADSCRSAGAGLVQVIDDHTCKLVVDFDEFSLARHQEELRKRVHDIRRRLDSKKDLLERSIGDVFATKDQLTQGMSSKERNQFLGSCASASRATPRLA